MVRRAVACFRLTLVDAFYVPLQRFFIGLLSVCTTVEKRVGPSFHEDPVDGLGGVLFLFSSLILRAHPNNRTPQSDPICVVCSFRWLCYMP